MLLLLHMYNLHTDHFVCTFFFFLSQGTALKPGGHFTLTAPTGGCLEFNARRFHFHWNLELDVGHKSPPSRKMTQSCHLDGTSVQCCHRAFLTADCHSARFIAELLREICCSRETRHRPPSPPLAYEDCLGLRLLPGGRRLASHCLDGVALPSFDLIRLLSVCQERHRTWLQRSTNRVAQRWCIF